MNHLTTKACALASLAMMVLIVAMTGCGEDLAPEADEPEDAVDWLITYAPDYLEDRQFRRAELEASLWRPELPYARKRLAGYARAQGGWDLLPELAAKSAPVGADGSSPDFTRFDTTVPTTRQEWLALGEEVFWKMPMRRDDYLEWVAERPETWEDLGIPRKSDGSLQGIVRFEDARGAERIGATCGLCHGGGGVAGRATTDLDLGAGRALYNETHGVPAQPFDKWGPGRIDVTDDPVDDALRVPNLWALDQQSHINTSGAVKLDSPAALAVRFETQYIIGHSLEARPNRVLSLALAIYVMSLEPATAHEPDESLPGAPIFDAHCAGCHSKETGYGGGLVDADEIVGDAPAAGSPMRGTGLLKVPTLVGISAGGPYFHDGRHDSLEQVLESGHPRGQALEEEQQQQLIEFLKTL